MAELTYFNNRGLAEINRMIMTILDIPFKETDLQTREEYVALLPELRFGQVPLLRIDGLKLVQSGAIARYLARKGHLLGDNEIDNVKIDILFDGSRDFLRAYLGMGFQPEPEDVVKAQAKEKAFPKYLPAFEKALAENKSGFLVGDKISLADLGLMECLLMTVDYFGQEPIRDYPQIKAFYDRLSANEKMKKYIHDVRKPKTSPEVVATVRAVLSHLTI